MTWRSGFSNRYNKDMNQKRTRWAEPLFFTILFIVAAVTSQCYHSKTEYFSWRSELWADRAASYIYLPATFYYHWDTRQCPPHMDERTGFGFTYDTVRNKICTPSSYGIAFFLSPFFVGVHYITKIFHIPQDWAFAPIYHKMTDVAAVFYLVLGLWFLRRFLLNYFSEKTSFFTVLFVFTGTNLFYYTVMDPVMPHVYSFFLASVFLYSLKEFLNEPRRFYFFILACFSFSFAFLVSYSALFFIPVFIFLDVSGRVQIRNRLKLIGSLRNLVVFLMILLLVMIPQMVYNRYLTGQFLTASPEGPGFYNLTGPRIFELWFSPLNGLFIYSPMMLLILAGIILMFMSGESRAWMYAGLFILVTYLYASWWKWYFGCSYGQRYFVDLLPFLSLPFGFLAEKALGKAVKARFIIIATLALLFSYYNIRMAFAQEGCFFGSTWDWNRYSARLNKAGILPVRPAFRYFNDFENDAYIPGTTTTNTVARSGDHSAVLDSKHEFALGFSDYPGNILPDKRLVKIISGLWVFKTSGNPTGAVLICEFSKDGNLISREEKSLDVPMSAIRKWYFVPLNFDISDQTDEWALLKVYIWNKAGTSFYVDDVSLDFKAKNE